MAPGERENIADGLVASASFRAPSASPKKAAPKKKRAKSIGPGGLDREEEAPLKASHGNRRKSAFVPAVKSILSSNAEEERKRKEARRKSLAKRRVSFAPEATLHTWDVVEYMRDATSSSAASDATRRASLASQAPNPESDPAEPPSTPPEQVVEPALQAESSPANQRESHQKKNRRSSGIPPMNFNNPDDVCSSSPLSGDNVSPGDRIAESESDDDDDDDDDDATADLGVTPDTDDSSQSSARLDAALRQAFEQAGTQRLDFDDDGEATMEMADDEVTAAFKPWARTAAEAQEEQEATQSSSPARSDAGDDMSMDVTRAIGRIVEQPDAQSSDIDDDTGMSMELTMPLGSIQAMAAKAPANRRKSLKRRVSAVESSLGSPAKKPASRRTSLRPRRKSEEPAADDATMDLTMAIGGIKSNDAATQQDDDRRSSMDSVAMDETMDFTMAVGSIKTTPAPAVEAQESDADDDGFTMEFTKVVGPGIKRIAQSAAIPEQPAIVDYPVLPEVAKTPTPEKHVASAPSPTNSKTPTPKKSPKESPQQAAYTAPEAQLDPLPAPVERTPTKSASSKLHLDPGTPEFVRQLPAGDVEPSPFVRRTPLSAIKREAVSTPIRTPVSAGKAKAAAVTPISTSKKTPISASKRRESLIIPADPVEAPILKRRRSSLGGVQFSPIAAPREEPTLRSTALLSNSIKMLSTPRKVAPLLSPVKRGMTPKKSQTPQKQATPKQKTPTPKKTPRRSLSPKKRVMFGAEPEEEHQEIDEDVSEIERISLSEFLSLTKISFMDVSASKRRATVAPAAFRDMDVDEAPETLDRYVVAGACVVPEYELYSHACHEMKRYISSGREAVRQIESNVEEENPLLFSEYLAAPPDQRAVMDKQFLNARANARLDARGEWYSWRSTLLGTLKGSLLSTLGGFKDDDASLADQERLLDVVLPPVVEKQEQLSLEKLQLQQRHDELNSCDREELEQTRESLIATDAELQAKREFLTQLQQELADKEARIDAIKERRIECLAEIKAAERVREECRGWSTTEVRDLKAKVTALEDTHGWSITSASSSSITMTHLSDLELYFQPSCFATGATPTPNGSISLAYIGDSAQPHPRPLTTSKRFFLQLIRAQLHCIPQSTTSIAQVLALVKNGWSAALAVVEGVRWLEHSFITEECILSDELMGVQADMLLPTLQTKVRVHFEIGVKLDDGQVETEVGIKAEIVYGEKYGEEKMGAFLRDFCGATIKEGRDMMCWADGLSDLRSRLKKTGRKGERK